MIRHTGFVFYYLFIIFLGVNYVLCGDYELYEYLNRTQPVIRQIYEFKLKHPKPIGVITTSAGDLVEIRDTITLNSDAFSNQYFIDLLTHSNNERIPERSVHSKGTGAHGYFEVTHDVSKYTKADVFNGVGKKTSVFGRFSVGGQDLGGSDLLRDLKGLAVKFYTKEGNLDFLCLQVPVFFLRDPLEFPTFVHSAKRNPKTNMVDFTTLWDFITKRPMNLNPNLWLLSDFGIPNGYRKMNVFPIHTYEIHNKHGDRYFVRFNFITNQGLESLSSEVAAAINARDPDYFIRDLYNAIENKNYPSWTLEMDIMSLEDIRKIDYDPFDVIRLWKKGTYKTVPIGNLVFNRNPDNQFRDKELSAFNPANLVSGIPGPIDAIFRGRRSAYRDAQVYRLGVNHNRVEINRPLYWKVYNRDGVSPVRENMRDAPNYYPNSFNGPVPHVDPSRPKTKLVHFATNAVDLQPTSEFYNSILQCDAQRQRLINNTVTSILPISPELQRRVIRLLTLTDQDLGTRVAVQLQKALRLPPPPPPPVIRINACTKNMQNSLQYRFT